jgi:hypothetical protein
MKVNLDIRDLKQGRYMVLILSAQIICKKIKYANSHTEAIELANKYEQTGCICVISRVLNNSLDKSNKRNPND